VLLLFDIDGTLLLRAADAHRDALHDALEEIWGVDLRGVRVQTGGRTDPDIARDILLRGGVSARAIDGGLADFREAAARRYAELVPDDLSAHVAPHAVETLQALDGVRRLSLVTGNLEPIARLKLRAAGLGGWFADGQGGFGSDSEDRSDLPAVARRRAGAAWNGGAPWPRERTVVVGDTPRDIACARADGVRVVAVATGPFAAADLHGAYVVLEDLRGLAAALDALG
jgi:phosphoglycolate phosphatase-like HAD superfamily hydrolase